MLLQAVFEGVLDVFAEFNIGSHGWGAGGSQNDWSGAWQHTSMGIVGEPLQ